MTDNVEAVANATEAAPAAREFKTNAVPSAIPAPEPPKTDKAEKPEKVEKAPQVEEEAPEEPDTEDSAASDGADAPAHPKNKGVGKRINELTKEKYDAIREREQERQEKEYWRDVALGKKEPPQSEPKPTQAAKPEVTGKPKLEDFDFDMEAHAEALVEWKLEQREKQREATTRAQTIQEKERQFAEEHPDYMEVTRAPHVPFTETVLALMSEADNPPAIAYYLANNLDEAAAIAQLSPVAAARAIGRIEAKLDAPKASPPVVQPKKTTNAPPPPKTISGAGKPEVSVDDPGLSTAQRIALWKSGKR